MDFIKEMNITKIYTISTILMVTLSNIFVIYILVSMFYRQNYIDRDKLRVQFEKIKQNALKYEVKKAIDDIKYHKSKSEEILRESVKSETLKAYQLIESIYNRYIDRYSIEEIKDIIKTALRDIRFNENRGYFFIDSIDGEAILLPTNPKLEGSLIVDNQDNSGHYIMREFIKIAKTKKEGFSNYSWYKLDSKKMHKKIAFIKYFEPLEWIVGTGEYLSDIESDIKRAFR